MHVKTVFMNTGGRSRGGRGGAPSTEKKTRQIKKITLFSVDYRKMHTDLSTREAGDAFSLDGTKLPFPHLLFWKILDLPLLVVGF